jgi:MraZ protein
VFFGTYRNSIDDKGRCMIPAKLRRELGDECMVTLGLKKTIYIYTKESYTKFLKEHVDNRPLEDEDALALQDFFTNNAVDCALDRQGRVNIPASFLEYAGIEKDTVTAGSGDHITIWSRERYDVERSPAAMDVDALLGKMLKYVNS